MDDEIFVRGDNNTLQIFSVSENARTDVFYCEDKINHVRIDYKTRRTMVSCDNKVKVLNRSEVVEEY